VSHSPSSIRMVVAALAALGTSASLPTRADAPPAPPAMAEPPAPAADGTAALAGALCRVHERVSPRHDPWSAEFCASLATAVEVAAVHHGLSPALLVAVMINESDLDARAVRAYRAGRAIAKDSGLMGIRCRLDGHGLCTNALVQGMTWRQVMDPITNVELGARYLAMYRDGAGRSRVTREVRDADGSVTVTEKSVPCRHRDHAYWAHYNHGTHFISEGSARFYPNHVAVLEQALSETLGLELDRPAARYSLTGLQRAERAAARRYVELCRIIRGIKRDDNDGRLTASASAEQHVDG
jgi:hypothetical protein